MNKKSSDKSDYYIHKLVRNGKKSLLHELLNGQEVTTIDEALMANVYVRDYLDIIPMSDKDKAICNFLLLRYAKDID